LALSPHRVCNSNGEIQAYFEEVVADGYEGVVVRNGSGMYLSGYRSFDAMKYKAVEDGEFECVDFEAGKRGKDKDKLMLVFATSTGKRFVVRPNLPLEKRGELYQKIKTDPGFFARTFAG
jgi:ATP-dependent DNA ligase